MKKLGIIFFLFLISMPGFSQEAVQDLDAPLENYSTYAWISDIDQIPDDQMFIGPNGVMIFNNESVRKTIQDAISTQLEAKGYTMDESNPDMLIGFQVLEQKGEMRTYTGYETTYMGLDTLRTEENVETVQLEAGTLLINISDKSSGKIAWQGYSSGALNEELAKNQEDVEKVVSNIFDEFEYSAFDSNK